MGKLLFTLAVIGISLACGYAIQHYAAANAARLSLTTLNTLRRKLQMVALFLCIPLSAMLSLWGLPEPDSRLLILPILGICSWSFGGLLGLGISRILRLDRKQTGSMFCCGAFANIGAVGALVCVVFWGEQSIALVTLYRLFEECFFFGVAFPVAQWFGDSASQRKKPNFLAIFKDPAIRIVISALLLGVFLNWAEIERPAFCADIASGCAILATALFLTAIGMGLRISQLNKYGRHCLGIAGIKFFGVPLLIVALGWLCGLGTIDNGLPLKVAAVVSSMPVAMNALVPPALFELDLDLANACWLFTTGALAVVLPVLMCVTSSL